MRMHNPPHPGLTLRDDVLPALGLERGGEARLWLAEQTAYDMWQAEQKIKAAPLHVQRAPALRDLAPA